IEHKSEKSQYGAMSTVLADGRAVAVSAGGRRYAVAVLGYRAHTNPGLNAQKLILISEDGEGLDMIGCMMNAWHGQFVTEVLREPAADGAQLVVRLVPAFKTTWHPWHVITYRKLAYSFDAKEPEAGKGPTVWFTKGLCRVAIRGDKLVSVFP